LLFWSERIFLRLFTSQKENLDNSMSSELAVDIGREALLIATIVATPILVTGMIVGLVIGLVQALTQVQEQTVAFIPKLIAMVLAMGLFLPWILTRLVEYARELIVNIPTTLS
jgi:flagellar biosynthetic protein FliQ